MAVKHYRDLKIWQKAIMLTKSIYQLSLKFPDDERFGLKSQVKRSSVSVSANIAEGHGRSSDREFLRFLDIAYGSLMETETHLILAFELNMIEEFELNLALKQSEELGKMINGLKRSVRQTIKTLTAEC